MNPLPGAATEQDILDADDHHDRLYELIDGVMLEKIMSTRESRLASAVIAALYNFVSPRKLGAVLAPDGMLRLAPRLVLIPDVSFVSRANYPGGKFPKDAIAALAPDLAVEILSRGNTKAEMARKRRQYFDAGTKLVWEIDPEARSVSVFTSPDQFTSLDERQTLDGRPVLDGFCLSLTQLFAELEQ